MKQITDKAVFNNGLSEPIKLLKSLGFVYNSEDIDYPVYDLETHNDELIMVESGFSRNRLAVVLGESYYPGMYTYTVYVQEDAGCGWVSLPFRWSELNADWLTCLKKAFEGEGFSKGMEKDCYVGVGWCIKIG